VDTISTVQYGIASWYGEAFQGRPTASGETYEMFNLTAAHREVAFGTQAVVTNLDNGKTVRVRINDRGPFKYPRILDLSYGAARLLDMVRAGSARVKIVFLTPGAPAPLPLPRVYTVQAGAYRDFDNATRVQQILAIIHPTVAVTALEDRTQVWYRVRLGQFTDRDEAQRIARQIQEQGYVASVVALSH
jgi:rare lipoprotein A